VIWFPNRLIWLDDRVIWLPNGVIWSVKRVIWSAKPLIWSAIGVIWFGIRVIWSAKASIDLGCSRCHPRVAIRTDGPRRPESQTNRAPSLTIVFEVLLVAERAGDDLIGID
jgi:hypothetical protein